MATVIQHPGCWRLRDSKPSRVQQPGCGTWYPPHIGLRELARCRTPAHWGCGDPPQESPFPGVFARGIRIEEFENFLEIPASEYLGDPLMNSRLNGV